MILKIYDKLFFNKLFILIALILCFQVSFSLKAFAAETQNSANLDVIFVLDSSQSMLNSDPKSLRVNAVKLFIDMCHLQGDSAGMVAFSGNIVKEVGLTDLNNTDDKQKYKDNLTNIPLGSNTDIGIGLKEAVKLMDEKHNAAKKPVIIVLSDGNDDPSRDKTLSVNDLNSAVAAAKSKSYPIYTIGLNADGSIDKSKLEWISSETSAKNFITATADDLTQILKTIFIDNSESKVVEEQSITGNNEYQDVTITIPDSSTAEANISILSSSAVDVKVFDPNGKEQVIPSKNVILFRTESYSIIKILTPLKGNWLFKVKGATGDKIDTSLVSNNSLNIIMELSPKDKLNKGDTLKVNAYITSNNEKITDEEFYKSFNGKLLVTNTADKSVKEIQLSYKNNSLYGEYFVSASGEYEFKVKIDSSGFSKESAPVAFKTVNRAPEAENKSFKFNLSTNDKNVIINLSKYFKDLDGDEIKYTVSGGNSAIADVSVTGESLIIIQHKKGSFTATITADDGDNGILKKNIEIKVTSKLFQFISQTYIVIILGILIIVLIIFIIINYIKMKNIF